MRRSVRVVAAAIVLALVGLAIFARRHESAPAAPHDIAPAAARAVTDAEPEATAAAPARPEPSAAPASDEGAAPIEDEAPAPSSVAMRALVGTIVVVDERGVEHPSESGSFTLLEHHEGRGDGGEVVVESGAWRADVRAGVELSILGLRLGDRPAKWLAESGRFRPPEDGVVALRARWPAASILHVREAGTGRELPSVELWVASGLVVATRPGEWCERVATDAASPIDVGSLLPEQRRVDAATFFARSDAFAWGRIDLDLGAGGERTLDLSPGGSLEVQFSGGDAVGCVLALRREGRAGSEEWQRVTSEREIEFEDLSIGRLQVALETFLDTKEVVASVSVDVVAGARARVVLNVPERAPVARVRIAGVVRVHQSWHAKHVRVDLESTNLPRPAPERSKAATVGEPHRDGAFDVFPFEAEGVAAGRVVVGVRDPFADAEIDVGPDGRDDVVVDVAAGAHVAVRLVDAATGEAIRQAEVQWRLAPRPGRMDSRSSRCTLDESTGCFEFDAPPSDVDVFVQAVLYAFASKSVSVHEGANEVTVELERPCGVRLRVVEGETAVPFDPRWRVRLVRVDGDGHVTGSRWGATDHAIDVSAPGRYRLSFPALDGFADVPEQEIVIEAGRVTDVVVRLERER